MPHPFLRFVAARVAIITLGTLLATRAAAQGVLTLRLEDYAAAPITGFNNPSDNSVYVARINFLREEPGGGLNRFFVCDLNGRLYILDQASKQFTTYLDFNRNTTETPGVTGLFPAFTRAQGYANGLVTFQFDPEYRVAGSANYGKFYTVHIEMDTNDGAASRLPNASAFPGFNTAGYAPTAVNEAPGTDNSSTRQAVLIEWQDTNPTNTTFEGTARELLRIEFNGRIHPMGDLAFNPRALSASDPDWRKLYIAVGDGGAGEQNNAVLHPTPQRRDVLQGKILRISPDDPDGAGPRRYGIPADNAFVGASGTREEIFAYGFRNPHRLAWDPLTGTLLVCDIGFHSWEEVNVVHPLANYGWGEREGTWALNLATGTADGALPAGDASNGYTYPVIQYSHSPALGVGDAISGGFVYRGTRIPELRGKFIFGDITTGELFYADLAEMLAADDGNPATLARFYHLDILWDNPRNAAGPERFDRMYEIVADTYHARGGTDANLPGSATVSDLTGGGRADIRFAMDQAGELYLLSKSDGMIRAITGVVAPPAAPVIARQPESQTIAAGGTVAFTVAASEASTFQWKHNGTAIASATAATFTLRDATAADIGSYSVDVTNAAGTTASAAATLAVTAVPSSRLANFSARANAGTGTRALILGFGQEGGSGAAPGLLIRGLGPSLAAAGIASPVADPQLELFQGNTRLRTNDNWTTADPLPSGFGAQPPGALPLAAADAVLYHASATPGAVFTAVLRGTGTTTGVALVELYEVEASGRRLANTSARAGVDAGENALIAGFVLGGTTARTVLIRAAGPAIASLGVAGTLPDPKLTLFRGSTVIAENDNWQSSTELVNAFRSVGAFDFVARSRDAVLYLTLPPGAYTAHVTGVAAPSGVALLEVYLLP